MVNKTNSKLSTPKTMPTISEKKRYYCIQEEFMVKWRQTSKLHLSLNGAFIKIKSKTKKKCEYTTVYQYKILLVKSELCMIF